MLSQGVGIITGLQKKFDWAGVAAAGLSAAAGTAIGSQFGQAASQVAAVGQQAARLTASAIVDAATRSLVNGTDFGDNLMAALPDIIGQTIGGLVASIHWGRRNDDDSGVDADVTDSVRNGPTPDDATDSPYRLNLDTAPIDLSDFYRGLAIDQQMATNASQSMAISSTIADTMLQNWYGDHPDLRPLSSSIARGDVTNATGNMGSAAIGGGDPIAFYLAIVRSGEPFDKVFNANTKYFPATAAAGHFMATQAITSAKANAGQWQLSYILARMSGQTGDNANLKAQVDDIRAYIADNNNWRNGIVEQGFVDLAKTEYGFFKFTGTGTVVDLGARAITGDFHLDDVLTIATLGKSNIGRALSKFDGAAK